MDGDQTDRHKLERLNNRTQRNENEKMGQKTTATFHEQNLFFSSFKFKKK